MALPLPRILLIFFILSILLCIFIFSFSLVNVNATCLPMVIDVVLAIVTVIYHGTIWIVQLLRNLKELETEETTTASQPGPPSRSVYSSIAGITGGFLLTLAWALALLVTIDTGNGSNSFMGMNTAPPRSRTFQMVVVVLDVLEIIVIGVISIWCTMQRNRRTKAESAAIEDAFFYSTDIGPPPSVNRS